MAGYLRFRQVCLVCDDLPKACADIEHVLGLQLAHRDPELADYAVENAVYPLGNCFIELLAPLGPDSPAAAFLRHSEGQGAFIAIFNCDDAERRLSRARQLGLRQIADFSRPDFVGGQLHPRDCRAVMIEFDRSRGEEDLQGYYYAAGGRGWVKHVDTRVARRIREATLFSPEPQALAAHWAEILERPCQPSADAPRITTDLVDLRFENGDQSREWLGRLEVGVAGLQSVLGRARQRGLPVMPTGFVLAGVIFELTEEAEANGNG